MKWLKYSPEIARWAWEKVQNSGGIWRDLEGYSFERFDEVLKHSDLLCDFGFGLGRVDCLVPGDSARIHGIFWSADVFRRKDWIRGAICLLGLKFDLKRIECVVPLECKGLNRLMTRELGFKYVGKITGFYELEGSRFADGNKYVLERGQYGRR